MIVNVTPLGIAGDAADELAFTPGHTRAAQTVFDVVAFPPETPAHSGRSEAGKLVITGAEVIALQAAAQFARYTGVTPTPEQLACASAFSRGDLR